jgi:hypothetical protein
MEDLTRRIVIEALENGTAEGEVRVSQGELVLYHALVQTYGLDLVGEVSFIPLLERSKARLDLAADWGI